MKYFIPLTSLASGWFGKAEILHKAPKRVLELWNCYTMSDVFTRWKDGLQRTCFLAFVPQCCDVEEAKDRSWFHRDTKLQRTFVRYPGSLNEIKDLRNGQVRMGIGTEKEQNRLKDILALPETPQCFEYRREDISVKIRLNLHWSDRLLLYGNHFWRMHSLLNKEKRVKRVPHFYFWTVM